jgi:Anaphase-promoting complex subunit 4 WD40 domain
MDSLEHAEQEPAEQDGEVAFTDLDPLCDAGSQQSSWLASAVLDWQRSPQRLRSRRRWRLASMLGLLLLLVILFSLNQVASSLIVKSFRAAFFPPPALSSVAALPAPLPRQDGIACLADAAWSPDNRFIAVLGYQDCPQDSYAAGLVNLYDARSRHLISQLKPGDALVRALNSSLSPSTRQAVEHILADGPAGESPPVIDYVHVIWSPDGQRLACTFALAAQQPSVYGVVLMSSHGRSAQVVLQRSYAPPAFSAEWGVDRTLSVVFSTSPAALALQPLPPALAYHWGANGTLVPETLLSTLSLPAVPPSPPGPIGNPDGDASFTIWQPGLAHVISLADTSRVSTMYTWSTDFAAWSPDGRYLVDEIGLTGLLQPPGRLFPSHKALVALGLNQVPLLPLPDGALLRVVQRATALAWSPDGRVLAAYTAGNIVTLYNCVNGHKLASLLVQTKYPAPAAQAIVMRWSPDGSHLLLSSVAWGLLSIWSPPHLS